jgi:hypothetical protein
MKKLLFLAVALLSSQPFLLADEIIFKGIKLLIQEGEQSRPTSAQFVLADGSLLVKEKTGHAVFHEIPITAIQEVVYERSVEPRLRKEAWAAPWTLVAKGKKHWLTVTWKQRKQEQNLVLKLNKKDSEQIIEAVESKTGKKVNRIVE